MKQNIPNTSRRNFFKLAGGIALVGAAGGVRNGLRAGEVTTPISEYDATAKALGYVADRKKADAKRFPQVNTEAGKTQSCSNCQQFTPKTKPLGVCLVLPTGLVNENGWCSAWVKSTKKG